MAAKFHSGQQGTFLFEQYHNDPADCTDFDLGNFDLSLFGD